MEEYFFLEPTLEQALEVFSARLGDGWDQGPG